MTGRPFDASEWTPGKPSEPGVYEVVARYCGDAHVACWLVRRGAPVGQKPDAVDPRAEHRWSQSGPLLLMSASRLWSFDATWDPLDSPSAFADAHRKVFGMRVVDCHTDPWQVIQWLLSSHSAERANDGETR